MRFRLKSRRFWIAIVGVVILGVALLGLSLSEVDVRDIATEVEIPTLVLHRKGDLIVPAKFGQEIASRMPLSRMVMLEGRNHWMVASDDIAEISDLIEEFVGT